MVTISITDMLGREVNTVVNEVQDAGYKSVIWDAVNMYGQSLSAGIYLYQIKTRRICSNKKKMILLK